MHTGGGGGGNAGNGSPGGGDGGSGIVIFTNASPSIPTSSEYPPSAMTGNSSGGYTTSASSTNHATTFQIWKVHNKIIGDEGWHGNSSEYSSSTRDFTGSFSTTYDGSSTVGGEWIQLQVPTAITITKIQIAPRNGSSDYENRCAGDGRILGSNNGSTWSNIGTFTGKTYTLGNYTDITVTTSTSYTYFRIVITKLSGNSGQTTVNIGEINYFGFGNSEEEEEEEDTNYETLNFTTVGTVNITGNGTDTITSLYTGTAGWGTGTYSSTGYTAPVTIEFDKTASANDDLNSYGIISLNDTIVTTGTYTALDWAALYYRRDGFQYYHNNTGSSLIGSAWSNTDKKYIVYTVDGYIKHYSGSTLQFSVFKGTGQTVYPHTALYNTNSGNGAFNNIRITKQEWNGTTYVIPGVLDLYSLYNDTDKIASAYGFRLLFKEYTGAHAKIKRSSDNAELDVTFEMNGDIKTPTNFTTWKGSDTLYVTKWYDQSGRGLDVVPINSSTPPVFDNAQSGGHFAGKWGAKFDGSSNDNELKIDNYTNSFGTGTQKYTIFCSTYWDGGTSKDTLFAIGRPDPARTVAFHVNNGGNYNHYHFSNDVTGTGLSDQTSLTLGLRLREVHLIRRI
jgi:hypothetical protein